MERRTMSFANVDLPRNKVTNLLKPVGDLILNEEALKTLPENVRLGVEAMGVVIGNRRGLKAELVDFDNIKSHRNCCCCCVISYNYFSDRYYMSVAAEAMLVTIKEIIGNEPGSEDVTRPERRGEMKAIPTNLAELKSRNELFEKIITSLASKDVNALGVFGMGGSGKTTLAIQVANSKAKSVFETAVMVEISESPNIESIQNQIGDGLDLDLNNVHGIREKAIRLHNRLTPKDESDGRKDEKKILIVLDNIWKKIDLDQMGIPRKYCKLLLTSRTRDVCKEMDVHEELARTWAEAIELARTWAEELVSSSMFLKGDSDDYVKIHDVVRESTMSFASKSGINTDGHVFLVDAIPRWICEETFSKYTGISLLAQPNYVPLSGVKADLLQILLLKGNKNHNSVLESNFFQGMTNLKVLEVLFMNFKKGLPESLCKLKVLKTLHLVDCELGDIKLIGELDSLLVLSLRGSSLKWLPDEIGKLYKLRVLDMSKCRCEQARFPANVIAGLSLLEGLYLVDSSFTEWAVAESTSNDTGVGNGADIDDLTKLEFLNVLEIHIQGLKYFPICDQFVKNLNKFQIIVGQEGLKPMPCQRALMVSEFDVSQELKRDNCLKELLKKADFLALKSAAVNNIVPELDEEGYGDLSRLELSNIDSISRICEGKAPTDLFFNLCHLKVSELEKLEELLPVNPLPLKLISLKVSYCNSLTYIFSEDDVVNKESDIIELPCLKTLKFDMVTNLISMVKPSNNDDSQRPSFFNSKLI
ncbi:disease resistance protein At4g27190-like [Silene latifolia]|uniref:disease resistance protein At4g27190-like n=1 Tax=Silene latifolia TaxID=37657 RepID=UPI003D77E52F